ncbi:MAG: tRNA (guanosine(37)-N1)-methyltransferase TrmD [Clostridia bacterium]|nr:tRNA (guanosine(37)-N1)-methyltransferase TrmD [Clostridia bacterium]
MKIDILTLFPEMFEGVLSASILGRAQQNGILSIETHDIRAFADNKHRKTDDYPFGGGAGLVMMAQPIFDCMESVCGGERPHRIMLTPRGKLLTSERAKELSKLDRIVLLCGHYEGVDERVNTLIDEEISIGDYVLTGGELPAMVLIDCLSRFIPGVLGSEESAEDESHANGLLEYPQYTRPASFRGLDVPEILLNGHHANIAKWRHEQAMEKTRRMRPCLLGSFGKNPQNKGK